jgi:uncharacterized protein (TIGR04255 family)
LEEGAVPVAQGWRPIHDNHAIDAMAVAVVFAEVVPTLLFKRVVGAAEEATLGAGLRNRQNVMSMQFSLGAPSTVIPSPGQAFNSFAETSEGSVPGQMAEQLSVEQNQMIYRTWRYISWKWQSERIMRLLLPLVALVSETVPISSIKMEYLDRFRFDGEDLSTARYSDVLREGSRLIAPHGLSRTDLWHSNTGAFLPTREGRKTLELVQIVAVDDLPPQGMSTPQTRWLNVTTTREDRFPQGVDAAPTSSDLVSSLLDQMHSELKQTLASIITDAMTKRIGLWA